MSKDRVTDEQLMLLALCKIEGVSWSLVARESQRHGGLHRISAGEVSEKSALAAATSRAIKASAPLIPELVAWAEDQVCGARKAREARLTTVLNDDYPLNLRNIFDLPPFLFYRGDLRADDTRAVAIVGARQATYAGKERAAEMTRSLVAHGVTVLSGLAAGIDTVAHRTALEEGGRTVAVIGTGILRTYPKENAGLAEQVATAGALVSQFFPDASPTKFSFPMRNSTMSGMGQGTVVIEASSTSGARMQARLALQHGKKVFLLRTLIETNEWARDYSKKVRAITIDHAEDVVSHLKSTSAILEEDARREQLSLLG